MIAPTRSATRLQKQLPASRIGGRSGCAKLVAALRRDGVEVRPSGSLDFHDPWGNNVQVVDYREIQFPTTPAVLQGMGFDELKKSERALTELRDKGLAG